jgi:hypothetical protein
VALAAHGPSQAVTGIQAARGAPVGVEGSPAAGQCRARRAMHAKGLVSDQPPLTRQGCRCRPMRSSQRQDQERGQPAWRWRHGAAVARPCQAARRRHSCVGACARHSDGGVRRPQPAKPRDSVISTPMQRCFSLPPAVGSALEACWQGRGPWWTGYSNCSHRDTESSKGLQPYISGWGWSLHHSYLGDGDGAATTSHSAGIRCAVAFPDQQTRSQCKQRAAAGEWRPRTRRAPISNLGVKRLTEVEETHRALAATHCEPAAASPREAAQH